MTNHPIFSRTVTCVLILMLVAGLCGCSGTGTQATEAKVHYYYITFSADYVYVSGGYFFEKGELVTMKYEHHTIVGWLPTLDCPQSPSTGLSLVPGTCVIEDYGKVDW